MSIWRIHQRRMYAVLALMMVPPREIEKGWEGDAVIIEQKIVLGAAHGKSENNTVLTDLTVSPYQYLALILFVYPSSAFGKHWEEFGIRIRKW